MKNEKTTWIFVFQKYGKFSSVSQGHFIKHKPLISEECHLKVLTYNSNLGNFKACMT